MKGFNQFIEGKNEVFETEQDIPEGRITSSVIKVLAMFIKKKVINYSKRLKSQDDINNKIDFFDLEFSKFSESRWGRGDPKSKFHPKTSFLKRSRLELFFSKILKTFHQELLK